MQHARVRIASPRDYEDALDVLEAVAAERTVIGAEPPIDRRATSEKWSLEFIRPDSEMFVAIGPHGIVGVAQMCAGRLGMYLLEEYRGRGLGTRLLETALDWAAETRVVLEVWPDNHVAIHLYERFGFERSNFFPKRYRRRSGEMWDSLEMTLDRS